MRPRDTPCRGWTLAHILNTHHHQDHVGGNRVLKQRFQCSVVGPRADEARIPLIDTPLGDGDTFALGATELKVFDTPGHTRGHIAFWAPAAAALFPGDTLFAMGCGRLFEGTPQQMWASLSKLKMLPKETLVFCAHEYTLANAKCAPHADDASSSCAGPACPCAVHHVTQLTKVAASCRWALAVDPDNKELQSRVDEVRQLRAAGTPTIPTTLGLEAATNPFLQPDSAGIRSTLSVPAGASNDEAFAEIRRHKDTF